MQLSTSKHELADLEEDVRGYDVIDSQGETVGQVNDLIVDDDEYKVRFVEVASGGFLGIGEKTFMIPVDAVNRVGEKSLQLDRERSVMMDAPDYDPKTMSENMEHNRYWEGVYGWYGYSPFWAMPVV
jgi:sporulation protein YlmC with PRC-barrel domain